MELGLHLDFPDFIPPTYICLYNFCQVRDQICGQLYLMVAVQEMWPLSGSHLLVVLGFVVNLIDYFLFLPLFEM